jgi:hypothetical protein
MYLGLGKLCCQLHVSADGCFVNGFEINCRTAWYVTQYGCVRYAMSALLHIWDYWLFGYKSVWLGHSLPPQAFMLVGLFDALPCFSSSSRYFPFVYAFVPVSDDRSQCNYRWHFSSIPCRLFCLNSVVFISYHWMNVSSEFLSRFHPCLQKQWYRIYRFFKTCCCAMHVSCGIYFYRNALATKYVYCRVSVFSWKHAAFLFQLASSGSPISSDCRYIFSMTARHFLVTV